MHHAGTSPDTNSSYYLIYLLACLHYEAYVDTFNACFHICKEFLNSSSVRLVNLACLKQSNNLQVSKVVDESVCMHIHMQLTIVSILIHIHLNLSQSWIYIAIINGYLITNYSDWSFNVSFYTIDEEMLLD